MQPALVAHGLVAAHATRVVELARLYGALDRAVVASGVESAVARDAHAALSARVGEWLVADVEAERRDMVTLTAAERDSMLRDIDHTIPAADFPTALPRAALIRFRQSAARRRRLEALGAPGVIIGNETGLLRGAIESGIGPIVAPQLAFNPERGFEDALSWGFDQCVICEPGASLGVNLGLGASPSVAALLGVTGEDYPLVPRGRFCGVSPSRLVRAGFEGTGPIGWAAGDDMGALARDLVAIAADQPAFAPELHALVDRIAAASRRGYAVIGLIEQLPPEADGEPRWFAGPDAQP